MERPRGRWALRSLLAGVSFDYASVDDSRLPPLASRLNLTKLFLELSLFTPALMVLQGIMAADDEEVEAWYLEGWCLFLMAEQAREQGEQLDGLTWEELARDSRDCLETCRTVRSLEPSNICNNPIAGTLASCQSRAPRPSYARTYQRAHISIRRARNKTFSGGRRRRRVGRL
jgi:hypothetical protein